MAALWSRQTPDLPILSQVFFDNSHTLALVLISNYCGGLCSGEKWHVLLKRNEPWVAQDWTRCMTISWGDFGPCQGGLPTRSQVMGLDPSCQRSEKR